MNMAIQIAHGSFILTRSTMSAEWLIEHGHANAKMSLILIRNTVLVFFSDSLNLAM